MGVFRLSLQHSHMLAKNKKVRNRGYNINQKKPPKKPNHVTFNISKPLLTSHPPKKSHSKPETSLRCPVSDTLTTNLTMPRFPPSVLCHYPVWLLAVAATCSSIRQSSVIRSLDVGANTFPMITMLPNVHTNVAKVYVGQGNYQKLQQAVLMSYSFILGFAQQYYTFTYMD